MQEMVDWLKRQESICLQDGNQYQADFLNGHISVALKLIEKEKQQIIDVFCAGDKSDCTSDQNSKYFAEQYYNEQYGV